MDYKLRRLDRTLASPGKVLEFYRDRVQLPDGQQENWDFVHHKRGGGACVVPVLPDGRILTITDRFGGGYDNRLDIFMNSEQECWQFGRQWLKCKVEVAE